MGGRHPRAPAGPVEPARFHGPRSGRIADHDAAAAGERSELEAVQRELEASAREREPSEAERVIAEAERRRDLEYRAILAGVDLPR